MPQNMDKTRSLITIDDERVSLPASRFLTPGTYSLNGDGSITIAGGGGGGGLNLGPPLVSAQLPDALTPDWNPGDLSLASIIQVSTAGNNAQAGGLVGGVQGYGRIIINAGAFDFTLLDNASGAPGNRFFLNGDKVMPSMTAFFVVWNTAVNGWVGVGA